MYLITYLISISVKLKQDTRQPKESCQNMAFGDNESVQQPLIQAKEITIHGRRNHPWMVYLSTFVAVCGSYEFGACVCPFPCRSFFSYRNVLHRMLKSLLTVTDHLLVFQAGYSSPTQSAITAELGLSTAEV